MPVCVRPRLWVSKHARSTLYEEGIRSSPCNDPGIKCWPNWSRSDYSRRCIRRASANKCTIPVRVITLSYNVIKIISVACFLACTCAHAAGPECYITDPKLPQSCVVDPAALNRSVIQYGDDSRLWKVFEKARAGKPITIAAIGGSITQGAWATSQEKNYVGRVFGWWRATFPKSRMRLVNAGIGQTNSEYGDKRLQKDLLRYKPDFVITEWANNDAITPEMRASYKRVVQRILAAPNHPAVLMLFTMDRKWSSAEDNQIPIGRELGVPMIALREAIMPLEKSGKFDPMERTADPIHPNDLGHQIIAQLVAYRLQSGLNNMHATLSASK